MISFFVSFFKPKTINKVLQKVRKRRSVSVVKDRCDKMRRKSVKYRASKRTSDGKTIHYQVAAGSNLLFTGHIDGADNIFSEKF